MIVTSNHSIPPTWEVSTIQEVAYVNPRAEKDDYEDELLVSFVPMPAVGAATGTINVSDTRSFASVKKGYTSFLEGDVLFAKITPCMENGKMAVVPRLQGEVGFGSTEFHVLRPSCGILGSYLYYLVSSAPFRREAEHNMTGAVGQRRVPTNYLLKVAIPLPPLNEQLCIVAKIDELFSELDDGIASLKTARAQLKIYRQALLKHAFEGKLTESWRKAHADQLESADQLLARIAKEREAHYQKQVMDWKLAVRDWEEKPDGDKRPPKPSQLKFDRAARKPSSRELPAGWHDLKLSDLVASIGQGWSPKCGKGPAKGDEWGVIKTTAIQPLRFNVAENKALTTSLRPRKWLQIEVGDILITRAGPRSRCGIVCRVVDTQPRIMLCDKAYLLRFPNSEIAPTYIEGLLNSPDLTRAIEKLKTGISDSGVNITQTGFLDLQVQIPPFEEQLEIHRILEEQISQIAHMEQDIEEQLQKAEALRQSILKKAFSGQLVAQDPTDEPASVLLERIRAGREAGARVPKARKKTARSRA